MPAAQQVGGGHGLSPDLTGDGADGRDGLIRRGVAVDDRFEFAAAEEFPGERLHVGPGGGRHAGELLRWQEMEFAGERVTAVAREHVRLGLLVAAQAAEHRFLHRFKTRRRDREGAKTVRHMGRVPRRRIAVPSDGKFHALERHFPRELEPGERGVVRRRLQVIAQAGVVEPQHRCRLRGGEFAHRDETQDEGRLRPHELSVGRVVELQSGFTDQGDRPLGQERRGAGHEAVGARQGESRVAGRLDQRVVGGAGFFLVGVLDVVDALLAIGRHTFRHQGAEQVVGRERIEQPPVRGLVGLAPDVGGALRHFEREKQRLTREPHGEVRAFTAILIGFVELRDPGPVAIEIGGKRGVPQERQVAEQLIQDARVLLLAGRREVGDDEERAVVGRPIPDETAEAVDQAFALEGIDEAAGAGIRDELAQQFVGLARKIGAGGGNHELKVERTHFLDWFDEREAERGLARQKGRFVLRRADRALGQRREDRARMLFEVVERRLAADGERHPVGGVGGLVKGPDLSGRGASERVLVADGEFALA